MADENGMSVTIGDETYELDDLTLGEIEELEDAFGEPIEQIDFNRAKAIAHIVWFAKRRKDPSFTLDDARQVKVSSITPQEEERKRPPTKRAKVS